MAGTGTSSIILRCRPDEISRKGHHIQNPFQKLEDISLVPVKSHHRISTGRCNQKYQPIFYASNYAITACLEAASNGFTKNFQSTTVTMGAWKIYKPLNLSILTFSSATLAELDGNTGFSYERIKAHRTLMRQNIEYQLNNGINHLHSADFSMAILDFFSDQLGKMDILHESDYFLSNIYCDAGFNRAFADESNTPYDGILYPSVKNALQEFNIALHPRAMGKLRFIGAEHIWVTRHPGDKYQFYAIDKGSLLSNGDLRWDVSNHQEF
jgi:RES domain